MKTPEKEKVINKYPGKEEPDTLLWFESGKRIRNVDFHRIEQNPAQEVLTPFELEVKQELASSPSPFDLLASQEEAEEAEREDQSRRVKLALLASKVKFNPMERSCYELLYEKKLSDLKVMRRLGINRVRLCQLKARIQDLLVKLHKQSLAKERRRIPKGRTRMTPRQHEVLDLRLRQGLSFSEIADRLRVKKQVVHKIFRRGVKKFSKRGNG